MDKSTIGVVAVLLTMSQFGCVPLLDDNKVPEPVVVLPAQFKLEDGQDLQTSGENFAKRKWDEFFKSQKLQGLIKIALKNNQELNQNIQEILIAHAEVLARRGEYLPKVGLGVQAGIEKVGAETSKGFSDSANGLPENLKKFGVGLEASWEVDLWSKLRDAAKSADLRFRASVENRNLLVTQLVAEIALSYYDLVALDNQIDILHKNIDIQTAALESVKIERQAARVTQLAVQRFEAEVLKNQSRLYDFEQERFQVENRINILVGRTPEPIARDPSGLDKDNFEALDTGLPAQLLSLRPDVRQAELELKAAEIDVDVARANFYPRLSIDAGVGFESFNGSHLFKSPESLAYNVAGNIVAPLINRAGIKAQYRSANAKQIQRLYEYEKTIVKAYTDVINQMVKFRKMRGRLGLILKQVEIMTSSVEISRDLFQAARADYTEVLLTQRDSLEAQMDLIETKKVVMSAVIGVYHALGGGWNSGKEQ